MINKLKTKCWANKKKKILTSKCIVEITAKETETDTDAGGSQSESENSSQLKSGLHFLIRRQPVRRRHFPESPQKGLQIWSYPLQILPQHFYSKSLSSNNRKIIKNRFYVGNMQNRKKERHLIRQRRWRW